MKGPEEKEHGAGCSAEWLVDQSRDSVSKGDLYGAKSWLLTAKSLYPKAFAVQYEAFLMEKRSGKLNHCGRLFFEMIKTFPKEEILWRELKKLVQSQDLNVNELDVETKFLRDMSESLPMKYQRELLLRYADNQKDLIEKCRISLVVMKKFHGGTKQYGMKLAELLTQTEKEDLSSTPLNIYRKMLVCDVLPVILKSPEVQVDSPGTKHKGNVVYLEEKTLFHWLELSFEFFIALNIHQSTLKYHNRGPASDGESTFDPDGDIGQNPWQSLHEILLLFAAKCGWTNVLKIKDKLDPSKSRSIRSKWKALNSIKDAKSPWGLFYSVLEVYLHTMIDYCSKMISPRKGQRDSNVAEYILLENLEHIGQTMNSQSTSSKPPKKKKKIEDGSATGSSLEFQVSIEDVNIQFSSMHPGQNIDLSDTLQVAIDCRNFLKSSSVFEKEFTRLEQEWSMQEKSWFEIFQIDSLVFQKKYRDIIEFINSRKQHHSSKDLSCKSARQYTQLAMCFFCIGEYKEASQMAINAIFTISKEGDYEYSSNENHSGVSKGSSDGRCLRVVLSSVHDVTGYCVDLLVLCVKDKLPDVDIRPDKDKIGPLYETRQDSTIGHLIVLLQYNWPKGEILFEQLAKTITTLGGLKYKQFFKYITNIDILEEFAYLNTLEKVQLELQETNLGDASRKTVTRGVNRENKEDFRSAIDSQISSDDQPLQSIILQFLRNEQQSLINFG
ncbi:integrator complex subunit 10-like [Rhopilema esculentum]|uniref:integrator complex subunit 10-like n=1 Tax=Rhopilema esculentum TaxID=499914 RepID=UPI0031D9EB84